MTFFVLAKSKGGVDKKGEGVFHNARIELSSILAILGHAVSKTKT